jgi:hypothetical protein
MFNNDQEQKIKVFATITQLINQCFDICLINTYNNILSKEESLCLRKCTSNYLELNNNITKQLTEDKKTITEKNKHIMNIKT